MKVQTSSQLFLGLFLLSQIGFGCGNKNVEDKVFGLQSKFEQLIEKIINVIHNFYHEIKAESKCIPDDVPDKVIDILKTSIECVEKNEKLHESSAISKKDHRKNFLKCFSEAKKDIEKTMKSIDTTIDYCPENMTEKSYQINVTTSYTKTFNIDIKNGLEIERKTIEERGYGMPCDSEDDSDYTNLDESEGEDANQNGPGKEEENQSNPGKEKENQNAQGKEEENQIGQEKEEENGNDQKKDEESENGPGKEKGKVMKDESSEVVHETKQKQFEEEENNEFKDEIEREEGDVYAPGSENDESEPVPDEDYGVSYEAVMEAAEESGKRRFLLDDQAKEGKVELKKKGQDKLETSTLRNKSPAEMTSKLRSKASEKADKTLSKVSATRAKLPDFIARRLPF